MRHIGNMLVIGVALPALWRAVTLLGDKTVLLMTHDPLGAIRLADVIYVMRDGGISRPFLPAGARPRLAPDDAQPDLQAALLEALL